MNTEFKTFFQRWIINTVAVLVAGWLVTGINYERTADLFLASLLLGVLNAFLRPLMLLLSLPLLIFSLGLFTLVINAGLLYLVGMMLKPSFRVDSFWSAFWGALIISFVSIVLNVVTGVSRVQVDRKKSDTNRNDPPGGNGPVIDV